MWIAFHFAAALTILVSFCYAAPLNILLREKRCEGHDHSQDGAGDQAQSSGDNAPQVQQRRGQVDAAWLTSAPPPVSEDQVHHHQHRVDPDAEAHHREKRCEGHDHSQDGAGDQAQSSGSYRSVGVDLPKVENSGDGHLEIHPGNVDKRDKRDTDISAEVHKRDAPEMTDRLIVIGGGTGQGVNQTVIPRHYGGGYWGPGPNYGYGQGYGGGGYGGGPGCIFFNPVSLRCCGRQIAPDRCCGPVRPYCNSYWSA